MTWKGNDPALEFRSIGELVSYMKGLNYSSWRPSGSTLHNTASPTLNQWWHSGTSPEQRMKNLQSYYENDMGWSAGPHVFVDGVSYWVMTPFNVKGVHSPSWNGTRLGCEMVGDYDHESDESGMGAQVMQMSIALFAEWCNFFGWEPNNEKIKLHKEDPATTHDCPGANIIKSEFLDDVAQYMGTGGGDTDLPPQADRTGTVYDLVTGDVLNIRGQSSSSSPIIGTAENDDVVVVAGEAYNGSTKWLRIRIGEGEGTGVEVYGWVSAAYVQIEDEGQSEQPQIGWRTNITATEFGGGGDSQDSAYPDIDWIDASTEGVALPYKWAEKPRPQIVVKGPRGEVTTDVVDLGPWNTHDPSYVLNGMRPLSEKQKAMGIPAQNGLVPTNDAGIDLTPPIAAAVGINGKGKVSWRFQDAGRVLSKGRSARRLASTATREFQLPDDGEIDPRRRSVPGRGDLRAGKRDRRDDPGPRRRG